jgi:hypothetical protein
VISEKRRLGFSLYSVVIDVGPSSTATLADLSEGVTSVSQLTDAGRAICSCRCEGSRRTHGHSVAHTNIAGENCTTRHSSPGGQGIGGSMPHGVPELLAVSTHTPLVAPTIGEKQKPVPQFPQTAPTGEQVTSGWVVEVVVVGTTVEVVVVVIVVVVDGGQGFGEQLPDPWAIPP